MTRLIIVQQHAPDRQALCAALRAALPDVDVHEAPDLHDAVALLLAVGPVDLMLVELSTTVSALLSSLVRVRMVHPGIRFAIMSSRLNHRELRDCIAAGLAGYIVGSHEKGSIVGAVRDMLAGGVSVPVGPAQASERTGEGRVQGTSSATRVPPRPDLIRLTQRQREVLALLGQGLSNKEIARSLGIAEPTAKIHVAALMRRVGARNRTEAAVMVGITPDRRSPDGGAESMGSPLAQTGRES